MTVNTVLKSLGVRYGALAIFAGGLLVGCVMAVAYVGQRLDNRARDAAQEQIDATYAKPAQEAFRRGDVAEYERLMQEYQRANERNAYSH